MKRILTLVAAMVIAMAFSRPVLAADYSAYSTGELAAMRGTMSSATEEERQSFRREGADNGIEIIDVSSYKPRKIPPPTKKLTYLQNIGGFS